MRTIICGPWRPEPQPAQRKRRMHLWAVAPRAAAGAAEATNADLFHNSKVNIDTGITGLSRLVKGTAPLWLIAGLHQVDAGLKQFEGARHGQLGAVAAHKLAPAYRQTLDLYKQADAGSLDPQSKAGLLLELQTKIEQFQSAFKELLGLDMMAFTARAANPGGGGPFRGNSADEMPRSVAPAEEFHVRVHTAQATAETRLGRVWLVIHSGNSW